MGLQRMHKGCTRDAQGTATVAIPCQYARNTPAAVRVLAGSAGIARRGPGEVPALKLTAEGFAGWAGHGRKEAVRTTVPVRVVDLAWDSIPDSNVSGDPSFASVAALR